MPAKVNFKNLYLTADDWGLSAATNQGILELVQVGIVRRVSVLSTFKDVNVGLSDLKLSPPLSLGLHFNLTDLEVRRSPASLLANWIWGRREFKTFVFSQFDRQLQAFDDLGIRPQHLDGHEHLHLLPGLLKQVARQCRSAGIDTVRVPLDWSLLFRIQAPIVSLSLVAISEIEKLGFKSLPFSYPSRKVFGQRERLERYLLDHSGCEILLHPAKTIDAGLEHYDHRFLTERVLQYGALKAMAAQS